MKARIVFGWQSGRDRHAPKGTQFIAVGTAPRLTQWWFHDPEGVKLDYSGPQFDPFRIGINNPSKSLGVALRLLTFTLPVWAPIVTKLSLRISESRSVQASLYASNAVKLRVDTPHWRALNSAHLKIVWKAAPGPPLTTWENSGVKSITRLSAVRHGDLSTASDP